MPELFSRLGKKVKKHLKKIRISSSNQNTTSNNKGSKIGHLPSNQELLDFYVTRNEKEKNYVKHAQSASFGKGNSLHHIAESLSRPRRPLPLPPRSLTSQNIFASGVYKEIDTKPPEEYAPYAPFNANKNPSPALNPPALQASEYVDDNDVYLVPGVVSRPRRPLPLPPRSLTSQNIFASGVYKEIDTKPPEEYAPYAPFNANKNPSPALNPPALQASEYVDDNDVYLVPGVVSRPRRPLPSVMPSQNFYSEDGKDAKHLDVVPGEIYKEYLGMLAAEEGIDMSDTEYSPANFASAMGRHERPRSPLPLPPRSLTSQNIFASGVYEEIDTKAPEEHIIEGLDGKEELQQFGYNSPLDAARSSIVDRKNALEPAIIAEANNSGLGQSYDTKGAMTKGTVRSVARRKRLESKRNDLASESGRMARIKLVPRDAVKYDDFKDKAMPLVLSSDNSGLDQLHNVTSTQIASDYAELEGGRQGNNLSKTKMSSKYNEKNIYGFLSEFENPKTGKSWATNKPDAEKMAGGRASTGDLMLRRELLKNRNESEVKIDQDKNDFSSVILAGDVKRNKNMLHLDSFCDFLQKELGEHGSVSTAQFQSEVRKVLDGVTGSYLTSDDAVGLLNLTYSMFSQRGLEVGYYKDFADTAFQYFRSSSKHKRFTYPVPENNEFLIATRSHPPIFGQDDIQAAIEDDYNYQPLEAPSMSALERFIAEQEVHRGVDDDDGLVDYGTKKISGNDAINSKKAVVERQDDISHEHKLAHGKKMPTNKFSPLGLSAGTAIEKDLQNSKQELHGVNAEIVNFDPRSHAAILRNDIEFLKARRKNLENRVKFIQENQEKIKHELVNLIEYTDVATKSESLNLRMNKGLDSILKKYVGQVVPENKNGKYATTSSVSGR